MVGNIYVNIALHKQLIIRNSIYDDGKSCIY